MEFGFLEILFGLAGVSMIAWVAVIGLWHTYMFPIFFKEDSSSQLSLSVQSGAGNASAQSMLTPEGIRPTNNSIGLTDRKVYTRKSLVLADFNPVEAGYSVNRLYSLVLLSLGILTFTIVTFGLHSAIV